MTLMMDYIYDSIAIDRNVFTNKQIENVVNQIDFSNIKRVIFVGSGSSDNAAVIAKYDFEKYTDCEVMTYTPEIFVETKLPEDVDHVLTVFTSATGNSRWTNIALNYAHEKGFITIALSAVSDSSFVKSADYFIDLLSGDEKTYSKSKGVSSTILTIKLLGLEIGKRKKIIDYKKEKENILYDIEQMESTLEKAIQYVNENPYWCTAKHMTIIGDKTHYGNAQEFALKLSETLNIPTKHSNMSEFVHGTHRGVDRNSFIIVILTDETHKEVIETIIGLEKIAYKVLVINGTNLNFENQFKINNPYHLDMTLSINTFIQVFSSMVPEIIGIDINSKINEELVTRASAMVDYSLKKY